MRRQNPRARTGDAARLAASSHQAALAICQSADNPLLIESGARRINAGF